MAPGRAAARTEAWRFAATWRGTGGHRLGIWQLGPGPCRIEAAIDLPGRAHGLVAAPDGHLWCAARRPGDWLLRWHPGRATAQWLWAEPDRCFTGHLLRHPLGMLSAETDLDSGQGLVVLRDPATLAAHATWPSGGLDPHQLLDAADGSVWVANGGIATESVTGRAKRDLDRMDASLVRLDPASGRLLGHWRLADPRLSIRHLARHADGTLGLALQAEHERAEDRARAPLWARFDGGALQPVPVPHPLGGYAGDIIASATGFTVSAPRAGGLAHWDRDGRWQGWTALSGANALATDADLPLAAAGTHAVQLADRTVAMPAGLLLDNHWLRLPGAA